MPILMSSLDSPFYPYKMVEGGCAYSIFEANKDINEILAVNINALISFSELGFYSLSFEQPHGNLSAKICRPWGLPSSKFSGNFGKFLKLLI